jgi:4-amino-4-deoxy-L-arabinose transferase-like glycosyltransferase
MVATAATKPQAARAGLALAFVGLGVVYAYVAPIGEAPDEAAHLAYVDHLAATGDLPPLPEAEGDLGYESYQPPLDYAVSAALLRLAHGGPVSYPFVPDPRLDFHRAGSRAFVVQESAGALGAARAIRRLRVLRLAWGVSTVLLIAALASSLAPGRPWHSLLAASFFAFSPQFLFVSATVNNDAALAACSAAALYGLVRLADEERGSSHQWTWGAGVCAGLALWAKASGIVLLPACLLVGWWLRQRGRLADALWMLGPLSILYALWFALSAARFGALLPPSPTGAGAAHGSTLVELLNPRWLASLWLSSWAKFGWLNLKLPRPAYLFFLVPSALVALGALAAAGGRLARPRRRQAALLVLTAATNVALVALFMVLVDWQHQGRFLFPSLGAFAGLAAVGLGQVLPAGEAELRTWLRWLPPAAVAAVLATAGWAALVLHRAYEVS